ncbi:MAG: glycoside hydrolase family 2 [Verrucomicrobia bacterium]|nr:glycoside hydrolase family 2 [Verrucomicrobiota bacterium]
MEQRHDRIEQAINDRPQTRQTPPAYPRPQFVRQHWLSLDGKWEFAFDDVDQGLRLGWSGGRQLEMSIVVPFPYQTELSGINDKSIHEVVWYAREFTVPQEWESHEVLLHFGAVDYHTVVWLNGHEVGHNRGGHVPFWFNIRPYLHKGVNRLTLRVEDRQDPYQPRGKQSPSGLPHGIDYYCTTGIWQSVWLEPVPPIRIGELKITPHAEESLLELMVYLHAPATGWRLETEVMDGDLVVAREEAHATYAATRFRLKIANPKLWSPGSPHLYDLRVRLFDGDQLLDEVESYAGLRSVKIVDGRVLLNDAPTFLLMVLDQGYWPESYLAAPSDDALRLDVELTKQLGFNAARKHQKIEDPRWLYWCDRLGLLVWGEMANARAWSLEAEERLLAEWERAIRRDYNHPCIITWVPVNESMGFPGLEESHPGQYAFLERIVELTRRLDSTRPVIDNDGWEHTNVTDICAIHDYTPTAEGLRERYKETLAGGPLPAGVWYKNKPLFVLGSEHRGQPVMLTEVGGFLMTPKDIPEEKRDGLYKFYASIENSEELLAKYRDLMEGLASLEFLAGFCYTQLTDVEQEINGLLTYDRKPKFPPEQIAEIHKQLFAVKS